MAVGRLQIANPDLDMRILIANRGEIARRVIRAARDWGVTSIAVYADPDAEAPFVREADESERIGPADLAQSYLSIEAILDAARRSSATHVHPGYGFLSERAEFARAVVDAGLTWIGPRSEAIDMMGSKIEARNLAQKAGVPVIPGYNESQADSDLAAAADEIGYPVLVKASAGGGGKGIRIAATSEDFSGALEEARTEAKRSFGDDAMIVERYITRPRHVEVQVAGDRAGTVVDVGTRECSVQRRYQKVLEEAPAPNLPDATRTGLRQAAVALAAAIEYDSVGTVEFIVDDETGDYFFLEMNTRIQVEHTVTEEVSGVDLIQLQIALAAGVDMPLPADVFDGASGHAIEVRINAEDPWRGHVPQTGLVERLVLPDRPRLRWDGAVEAGTEITPHYDSMIGKLIVAADSRPQAIDEIGRALSELTIDGVTTNVDFHRWLISQKPVRAGRVTTRFLDETPLPRSSPFDGNAESPWSDRTAIRLTPHRSRFVYESPSRDVRWDGDADISGETADVKAPFPGVITEVLVEPGDEVELGQRLATIEAMKMLHPLTAAGHGIVAEIHVEPGAQVAASATIITFEHKPPPAIAPTPTEQGAV